MSNLVVSFNTRRLMMVFGLSSFLACLLCSLTGKISDFSLLHFSSPGAFTITGLAVVVLFVLLPLFRHRWARIALSGFNFVLLVCWAAAFVAMSLLAMAGQTVSTGLLLVFGSAGRIAFVVLTVQWNYHMATLDPRDAMQVVLMSGFSTALLYIVLVMVGSYVSLVLVFVLTSLSIGLSIVLENRTDWADGNSDKPVVADCQENEPPTTRALAKNRALFFGSRLIWGALFGVLLGCSLMTGAPRLGSTWMVALVLGALIFLAGMTFVMLRNNLLPAQFATVYPLVLFLALLVCFGRDSLSQYGRLLVGLSFLPWMMQMWMQLPSYRDLVQMSKPLFAYLERLLSLFAFEFVAFAVMSIAERLDEGMKEALIQSGFLGWYALVLVAITIGAMCRHFFRYYPMHGMEVGLVQAREEASFEGLADQARLSEREREVFELLAEGYSRPYIEKRLYISTGTAKTHIYHIYKKLGVSSQDDLIELAKGGAASSK